MKELIKKSGILLMTFISVYLLFFAALFFYQPGGIPFIYRATQGNVWEGGGTWLTFNKFDKAKKWDVIVVGSSHAYRGYNPEVFETYGLNTYNLGSSNQHMMCSYHIVKNYLNKSNCKLLILDMYDKVFSNDYIESKSDLIQNITNDKAAIQVALEMNDIRAINMITLRFFNKTIAPLNVDTNDYYLGFKKVKRFLNPKNKDENKLKWKYASNKHQESYLKKLLAYCQEEGIQVVAVSHPSPDLYKMAEHDKFVSEIQGILTAYKVPYYDYTNGKMLGGIYFYADPTHLNHIGVKLFNKKLIQDLISDQIIANTH